MARSREDKSREEARYCVNRHTERTSKAFSLLFQSWLNMGSQVFVGSTRVLADTLQDLNDLYCDPRGGANDRQYDDDDRRRRDD